VPALLTVPVIVTVAENVAEIGDVGPGVYIYVCICICICAYMSASVSVSSIAVNTNAVVAERNFADAASSDGPAGF
jgi:hypothetical protein